MMSRYTLALAAAAFVALTGCDVGSRIPGVGGSENAARLRIVNASGVAVDLTSNGQIVGGSGHVNAGATSSCITLDPATTTTVGLRLAGAVSDMGGFTGPLTANVAYTVVVFTSDAGTTNALTLTDEFTPTSGLAGFRIVDVAPGLGTLDVYVTPHSGPLGVPSTASIGYGGNTGFFDVNPGPSQVRFTVATTQTLVFDAGSVSLVASGRSTMVLAQPGGTDATPVATLVSGC